MAFLDNSGDIILDAVLTDTGRYRLAKGDGSFRVTKFALGDDEINYRLYDKNHASGSAYYDLNILQTPILEAFTDNAASLKSKLISISRNNLLYLPVIKLSTNLEVNNKTNVSGGFYVAVDRDTEDAMIADSGGVVSGTLLGETGNGGTSIRVDQGLDTTEVTPAFGIDADLVETQYIIEIDNRLGTITDVNGKRASVSYVDDDNIASYFFTNGTDANYVSENTDRTVNPKQVIAGPRGTSLAFKIKSSQELNTSTFLFQQLGADFTVVEAKDNPTMYYIDTIVRVTGATTGYRIDIPVRFVKVQ